MNCDCGHAKIIHNYRGILMPSNSCTETGCRCSGFHAIKRDDERLDEVNQWLLSMERPKVSDEDIQWHRAFWGLAAITIGGGFADWFIKESYPGGMGDANVQH